jgi:hypothetical protein
VFTQRYDILSSFINNDSSGQTQMTELSNNGENILERNLRDFEFLTILTQHPLQVISGGWSRGRAV